MTEPLIHSHIEDGLPNHHTLAWQSVYCASCEEMVHGLPNECMQTWVETGKGNYCLTCFTGRGGSVLEREWALHVGDGFDHEVTMCRILPDGGERVFRDVPPAGEGWVQEGSRRFDDRVEWYCRRPAREAE